MEKERRIKILSIIALIIAILGLTVAFAALSETLTINGTASVDAASWDIHFENLSDVELQGDASISTSPELSGNIISNINAVITKPNDGILYEVDVVNNGTIDAKISSIEVSELCTLQSSVESCDWNNDGFVTEEDVNKVNDNISFLVFYVDENVNSGNATEIKVNDLLPASNKRKIRFLIAYTKLDIEGSTEQESTELPKRDLQFNDLNITINYVQAD